MLGISKPTNKVSKDIPTQEDSPLQGQTSPKAMNTAQSYSPTRTPRQDVTDDGEWKGNNSIQSTTKELSQETGRLPNAKSGRHEKVEPKSQTSGYAMTASYTPSNIQE
ncbi:hypothetical protein Cob_v007880 [Colletotrichum orbiculare MAFF 240422]|uniref:Uncharacterized protein n=1 Tax=Colletotrichum orbiculare (strain 104-T / ATCC 96160 / CBS 514.97 / LARS 414 / MAFF 240422) TaxID=1213857 RepID=A0A484FNR9_COLOR|nr:hypothetical protein Cob_v007880 [Colletotrichum orbiculare MAFF 240422]